MFTVDTIKLENRTLKIAVHKLKVATEGLQGEERIYRMKELASEMIDALSEAIDEVQSDLEYNPRKFLGIALYPDSIWSLLVFALTIMAGLIQSNLQ